MILLTGPLGVLATVNGALLWCGRQLAWVALAIMVLVILAQVFFRYIVGDALNWTEEAARFFMIWMVGLAAPSAYRAGGFVAIDMVPRALPPRLSAVLNLVLILLAIVVLATAAHYGWKDVTGFAGQFATASLKIPLALVGGENITVPRAWMMAGMLLGVWLLLLVSVELGLRALILLIDPDADVAPTVDTGVAAAGSD